jgi:hypothetical protein
LHWTGLNNEQETAVKRLTKALGITFQTLSIYRYLTQHRSGIAVTETFGRRINTHLLCPSNSGLKYDKALQWKVTVVNMDWLYDIAKQGRVPDSDVVQAQLKLNADLPGNNTTAGTPLSYI